MPNMLQAFKGKKPFSKTAYRAWNFSSEFNEEPKSNNNKFINKEKTTSNNIKANSQDVRKNSSENEQQGVSKALASQQQGVSKALASQQQGVSKALASQQQGVSKALASQQQGVSDPVSKKDATTGQPLVVSATGKELKLLLFLHQLCVNNCSLKTTEVETKDLNDFLGINSNRLRNLVLRLSKKKLIKVVIRNCSKEGAYRIFEFPKEIYDKLLCKAASINFNNQPSKALATPLAESHVVSSYINTTTTFLPEELQQIDFSPLSDIGFDESHIIQICREHKKKPELALSVEIIQNSINAFAFDLKHNDVASGFKSSPAVVLTSLLKKGQPYSSKTPDKVLSPREAAMQEYLQAQQKKNLKILEIETQTKDFAQQEWLNSLSEQELSGFNQSNEPRPDGMPEKIFEISRRKKALAQAKEYFNTIIWPTRQKEILAQSSTKN